jgi:hypothetical protein
VVVVGATSDFHSRQRTVSLRRATGRLWKVTAAGATSDFHSRDDVGLGLAPVSEGRGYAPNALGSTAKIAEA